MKQRPKQVHTRQSKLLYKTFQLFFVNPVQIWVWLQGTDGRVKSPTFWWEQAVNLDSVSNKTATWDTKRLQVPRKSVKTWWGKKKNSDQIYKSAWKSPGWKRSLSNYWNLCMLFYRSCNNRKLKHYFYNHKRHFLFIAVREQTNLLAAWCMSSIQALITDR